MDKTILNNIPDPLAPDHIKQTNKFGLQVALHISREWLQNGHLAGNNSLQDRRKFIEDMRLYYRGEQDTQIYKNWVARQTNDNDYLNMDWRPINFPEKFCNIVINGIQDDFYRLDISSIDQLASIQKNERYIKHKRNQLAMPMLEKAKEQLGVDLIPKGFVSDDDEEIELYMELKERPKIEIAEEINIDFVKKSSNWESIKYETDRDIVNIGICVVRCFTDPNDGVKLEYVNPEKFGHSFCNRNDFSDVYYYFYVETVTIADIKRETLYPDVKLREIARKFAGQSQIQYDYDNVDFNELLGMKIDVMRFCYKTSKEIIYKKYYDNNNNVIKLSRRDSKWEGAKYSDKNNEKKVLDTWYEGNYIIGSNEIVYGWKECENLAKDQMNKVLPPFICRATNIYKNRLQSFLSNIIPLLDQLQYQSLKIQHLIGELKPDLIEIDIDSLADLTDEGVGENKAQVWQTALSILNVKGVIVKKRVDMGEMGIKDGRAATPIPQSQGSALSQLLNVYANYYNQLREVTGVNPARDGSQNPNALVGINQMMLLASNTATKHIVDTATMFDKKVCETISSRIKTICLFPEAEHLKKLYKNAIGKQNVDALESFKNRHLHEFGFSVEMMPDKQMIDELKQDLGFAIQEGTVDVNEKYVILQLAKSNYKKAFEYMRFARNRRIKQKMAEQEEKQRLQTESNTQSAQAAEQAKTQAYQTKKQIDLEYEKQMAQIRLLELKEKQVIEQPIRAEEFEKDIYIEKIKNLNLSNLTEYKEKAKDDRTKIQATQQSKMIDQRNKNKGPIEFEKSNIFNDELFNID